MAILDLTFSILIILVGSRSMSTNSDPNVLITDNSSSGSMIDNNRSDFISDISPALDLKTAPHFQHLGVLHTLENLTAWAAKEEDISKILTQRLELLKQETRLIQSYLDDFKETIGKAYVSFHESWQTQSDRGQAVGSSAILAHRMTYRYVSITTKLRQLLRSPTYLNNQRSTADVLALSEVEYNPLLPQRWPGRIDKFMSLNALLHIQLVYGAPSSALSLGLDYDTTEPGILDASHCTELGLFALRRTMYDLSPEWLQMAHNISSNQIATRTHILPIDLVSATLNMTIHEHNRLFENRSAERIEGRFVHPIKEGEIVRNKLSGNNQLYYQFKGVGRNAYPQPQFFDLCSGGKPQTPAMQVNLTCYYENQRHPYLHIAPVKTEVLSESPLVVQFYDLLSNSTIEKIKDDSLHKLALSEVVGSHVFDYVVKYRSSVGSFLTHGDVPEFYKMSEIVSGLNVVSAFEGPQVVEYVYGRFYDYHTDALEEEEETLSTVIADGDRLATMLFYLELPDAGGLTPFCQAGVAAHPARGSAILWYSMYRNGTVRKDVDHGACPVVHGHKIIVNHWIRYGRNFQTVPCSLNQFE